MIDASKECRVYLMDTESIGGDDHRTPLYRTPLICNEIVDFAEAGIWGSLATLGRFKGHALGVDAVLGSEAFRSSKRRSSMAR